MFSFAASSVCAFTTGEVPEDGVYRFKFGVESAEEGYFAVPASAIYDVQGEYSDGTFSYGFLGTTKDSYKNDVPTGTKVTDPRQIDGFSVVEGQYIQLKDATDVNGITCVTGPGAEEYLPQGASTYEGRYPARFAFRAEEYAYYAVTATVVNASSDENADVTLYSERSHLHAHHMTLNPGETRTFAWSVELAPNYCKGYSDYYKDNAINVIVVGENAGLASVTAVKQQQTSGTVRGTSVENMNVGKSIWICTDSTGCDYPVAVPFCSLQNYGGVGAGLSRWAPADISICNQGEGGLATGSSQHRQSCRLKPGDYLYVEYGHNESSAASYTKNLETYLNDAKTAGAKLLIVSPVERHTSWNSTTQYWESSLAGIRDAGKAWVEEKIVQGETCVAFIDLNTHYLNWMNSEVDRVCTAFPLMNRTAAINYYYQSAKGKNVDGTHLNTAGEDQGAYWFWQAALSVVEAGEADDATDSQKAQAAVVSGITTGLQTTLGIDSKEENTPWLVPDEVIELGVAPNSYWDTPVTTALSYVKDAAVASVDATVDDEGVVTLNSFTMRILNTLTYTRGIIDVYDAEGGKTRYWTLSNYDATSRPTGEIVYINSGKKGFITSNKDKNATADLAALTIPAGGKAEIWFAVADEGTWQTADDPTPCSAKYPLEAWSDVLVDDDGTDASQWSSITQSEYTFTDNDSGYYDFTGTGYGSDGKTKKNFGMFRPFAKDAEGDALSISNGRYRVSFKVLYTAGRFTFGVQKAKGTTTSPTSGALMIADFTGKAAKAFGSTDIAITREKNNEDELVDSNRINVDCWVDVDAILDMDLGTADVSIGGSDYTTFTVSAYSQDTEIQNIPYNFFCFSLESQMSHFGALDDVKVVQLAKRSTLPDVAVSAEPNDAALGTVTINGTQITSTNMTMNSEVTLAATPAEGCAFLGWLDEDGNTVSEDAEYVIERCHNQVNLTADFRSVGVAHASVAEGTDDMGYVMIDGKATDTLQYYTGNDVIFTAVVNDSADYKFVNWTDSEGNEVSRKITFVVKNASGTLSYKATFAAYGEDDERVTTWDFSSYVDDAAVAATVAKGTAEYIDNGLSMFLANGDTITADGLYWGNVLFSKGTGSDAGRHIEYVAPADGSMTITFQVGGVTESSGKYVYPYLLVATNEQAMASSGVYASKKAGSANTDQTLTFDVTAGTLYRIYSYYFKRSTWVKISDITYTYAPVYYNAGTAVNNANIGSATATPAKVFAGKETVFKAKPVSAAYRFVNWTDADDVEVSSFATFSAVIPGDTTYTANFEAVGEDEDFTAEVNFDYFSVDREVSESGSSKTTAYGDWTIYTSDSSYGTDSITTDGIYWHVPANDIYTKKYNEDQPCDYVHYMKLEAKYSGKVSIVFSTDKVISKREIYFCMTEGELSSATMNNKGDNYIKVAKANTEYTLTCDVEEGKTYWFWCASQNWSGAKAPTATTITSISYSHNSDFTTLTIANDSRMGTAYVNGTPNVEGCNVQKGETLHFTAEPASDRFVFTGWKSGDGETVSETADFWLPVTGPVALAATWQRVNNFETVEIDVAEGETTKQVETIDASGNVTKTGAGTLVLIGSNSFKGELTVSEGAVKVGDYTDIGGLYFDLDASDTSTYTYAKDEYGNDTELVTNIVSKVTASHVMETILETVGKSTYYAECTVETTLNNLPALYSDKLRLTSSDNVLSTSGSYTTFSVAQYVDSIGSNYLGDWSDTSYGNRYGFRTDNGKIRFYSYNGFVATADEKVWVNGETGATISPDTPFVFSTTQIPIRTGNNSGSARKIFLGSGGKMIWGETVIYSRILEEAELRAVEANLGAKWGVGDYECSPIPATADIVVKDGATLDLGNATTLAVSSLTLESGATLKIPALPEDGVVATTTFGTVGAIDGVNIVVDGTDVTEDYVLRQTATGVVVEERTAPVYEYDSAEDDTVVGTFETYKGQASIVKSGAGTLTLIGSNAFAGAVAINAGTLKLGGYRDIDGITSDFDVSADGAVVTIDEVLTLKDSLAGSGNTLTNASVAAELVEEAATMNGKKALKGASFKMNMASAVSAKTTILAMHPFCGTTSWNVLLTDNESYSITCRNSSPWNKKGNGNSAYYGTDGIWQNGVDVDGKTQTTPMVMSIVGQWTKSDPACINLGWNSSSGIQAYSELVTYGRELTDAEREVVEALLMDKWGIAEYDYTVLPSGARVRVAEKATLDLGGLEQTVASLTLAKGAVVTNGTLKVTSEPVIASGAYAAATDNGDGTWSVVTLDGAWETVNKNIPVVSGDTEAEVTENTDDEGNTTYTVEIVAEEAEMTVPDNVTVSEVVVSTNTTKVTGVPDDLKTKVKVRVSYSGSEGAVVTQTYAIVAVGGDGAIALDEDAKVEVGNEEIPVKPDLADDGDSVEPFEPSNEEGDLEVGVKSIPGLVYRLIRGTSPEAISAENAVATEKATGSRVSLKDAEPPAGKAFYRISVDLK